MILPDEIGSQHGAHILRVLEPCEGHKTKAAALLRINRTTLWKKLRQYGIEGECPASRRVAG